MNLGKIVLKSQEDLEELARKLSEISEGEVCHMNGAVISGVLDFKEAESFLNGNTEAQHVFYHLEGRLKQFQEWREKSLFQRVVAAFNRSL